MSELKPCPICNSNVEEKTGGLNSWAECTACEAKWGFCGRNYDDRYNLWNTRAPQQPQPAPIKNECCTRWRDDALEQAAIIADQYGSSVYVAQDIRALKSSPIAQPAAAPSEPITTAEIYDWIMDAEEMQAGPQPRPAEAISRNSWLKFGIEKTLSYINRHGQALNKWHRNEAERLAWEIFKWGSKDYRGCAKDEIEKLRKLFSVAPSPAVASGEK